MQKGPLGGHRGAGDFVIDRGQDRKGLGVSGTTLDSQRALPRCW